MKQPESVHIGGKEYSIVREGSGQYTWYQLCEVLHRNERGVIDHYRRLQGYGIPRYKKDALALLAEIEVNGEKPYKEPRPSRKHKYVLGYHKAQISMFWLTGKYPNADPVTKYYYHIVEIDNPDALRNYQTRREYRGPEMQGITWKDQFFRDKIEAIAKELNKRYWQQRDANLSKIVLIVDRRPWDERG